MTAKLFIAVGMVAALTATVFSFGIRVAALVAWVVVVGAGFLYAKWEADRDRAARVRRDMALHERPRTGPEELND